MKIKFFLVFACISFLNTYALEIPIPKTVIHEPSVVWITYNYVDDIPSVIIKMEKRYGRLLQAYNSDAVEYNTILLSNLILNSMSIKIEDTHIEIELAEVRSENNFLEFDYRINYVDDIRGVMTCTYNLIAGADTHAQVKIYVVTEQGTRTFSRKKENQFIEINL